jgi:hypothetical protein
VSLAPPLNQWVGVEALTDAQMADQATARRLVKLDDGRIATLVVWPVPGRPRVTRGRSCVVEWRSGKRYRIPTRRVLEVAIPTA